MQNLNETFTEIKLWATLKARYCFMVPAQVRKLLYQAIKDTNF